MSRDFYYRCCCIGIDVGVCGMTAAAAVEPTELEELMKAQAEAAHEREVGDATRPTAEDLAASPTRIDVEGLDLFYGDHHALKDVNIKIRDKQITSFIGPSGCGKSTFLRCLNLMNREIPKCKIAGEVLYHGRNINTRKENLFELRKSRLP